MLRAGRATNQTTLPFSVLRDAVAPTVTLTVAERIAASDIPVQWSSVEDGSGIRGYDVEWRIKLGEFAANGEWQPWLTATTQNQATFTGTPGVAYTFRVRATDNVNNASDWAQAEARTVVVRKYYSVAKQQVALRNLLPYTGCTPTTLRQAQGRPWLCLINNQLGRRRLCSAASAVVKAALPVWRGKVEQRRSPHRPAVHRAAGGSWPRNL